MFLNPELAQSQFLLLSFSLVAGLCHQLTNALVERKQVRKLSIGSPLILRLLILRKVGFLTLCIHAKQYSLEQNSGM